MDPAERILRNLIRIQGLTNGLSADLVMLLHTIFDEVVGRLAAIDPTSHKNVVRRLAELERFLRPAEALLGERMDEARQSLIQSLGEIGEDQSRWALELLRDEIRHGAPSVRVRMAPRVVGAAFIRNTLATDPIHGRMLGEWFSGLSASTANDLRQQLRIGLVQSETISELVQRVRGFRGPGGTFTGGVLQTTTRNATAIVRTSVTHVVNTSHLETYRQSEVTDEYEYVATLDSRTTIICASLDGRRFRYDDPKAPRPPQHWQCRSITVPVVDWKGLGLEEPPPGMRAARTPDGKRTEVSASINYETWLKDQPESVQNRVLGSTRARMFRDGTSLSQLVKGDGTVIRIRDMRAKPKAEWSATEWAQALVKGDAQGAELEDLDVVFTQQVHKAYGQLRRGTQAATREEALEAWMDRSAADIATRIAAATSDDAIMFAVARGMETDVKKYIKNGSIVSKHSADGLFDPVERSIELHRNISSNLVNAATNIREGVPSSAWRPFEQYSVHVVIHENNHAKSAMIRRTYIQYGDAPYRFIEEGLVEHLSQTHTKLALGADDGIFIRFQSYPTEADLMRRYESAVGRGRLLDLLHNHDGPERVEAMIEDVRDVLAVRNTAALTDFDARIAKLYELDTKMVAFAEQVEMDPKRVALAIRLRDFFDLVVDTMKGPDWVRRPVPAPGPPRVPR